jgi:spore coat polysaccharide biosynthesis protein SpsF
MKIGFVIICRYNSNRLPGKILKEINGKPIIQYIIERLQKITLHENIVVATSKNDSDDPIINYCKENCINYFRGSLNNVAERFLLCSEAFSFDFAVRINGDNIFIDINIFKEMIEITEMDKYKFISNVKNRTFPKGMSIEIVKTEYYREMYSKFESKDHYEHVTLFLYSQDNKKEHFYFFNKICPEASGIQLAIDNLNDFKLAEKIIDSFKMDHTNYNLTEIYSIYKNFQLNDR